MLGNKIKKLKCRCCKKEVNRYTKKGIFCCDICRKQSRKKLRKIYGSEADKMVAKVKRENIMNNLDLELENFENKRKVMNR